MTTRRELIKSLRNLLWALENNLIIEGPDLEALTDAINFIEHADRVEQIVQTNPHLHYGIED